MKPRPIALARGCRSSTSFVLGFSVLLAVASPLVSPVVFPFWATAHAAPADAEQRALAREHFKKGQRLYNVSEYAPALAEFKAGFLLHDDPVFLYNIAQCHRFLGNTDEAITFYSRFLRERPETPNRDEVEKRLAELRALKAGEREEGARTTPQAPGGTQAPAQLPEDDQRLTKTRAGEQATESRLALGAQPPPETVLTSDPAAAVTPPDDSKPIHTTWWFWTGAGAVVVAGIVTGVLLLSSGTPDCAGVSQCHGF
jgi:hypothetical protein